MTPPVAQRTSAAAYPTRFFGAPQRSERIGRVLRWAAGVKDLDEELLDRIGRRMFTRDEIGARLVRAMGRDRPDAERVTMAGFGQALEHGIDSVPDAPAALREFFAEVDRVPDWVDFDLVERGARTIRRMGRNVDDVLLQLSLIGGYRFGGPADLLVATGGLTGSTAMRRLGETKKWAIAISRPGGMRRDGEGFKLTVHVRAMHALINHRFETNGRWDSQRWGLPINQADQAATLGLFNSTLLLGVRGLGWLVTPAESRAVMHAWKYVGWLMGVDEDFLFDGEREQNRFNYHILRVQDGVTPAGAALSGALVAGKRNLDRGRFSAVIGPYERLRLLSMLRYFLGKKDMRDLELPVVPVWAIPPIAAKNLVLSGLIARSRRGRRYLERAGDRFAQRDLHRTFGTARPEIGALPS
ncbi:oxygenase MpaB family protein [Saccharopolyspora gloriosae]|uniref:oxygenase MpaB family protein n=1 Tax=Saccharopolyspora gloriosae TaxID=455344 RepID=UPI001FB6B428|nr:oxygenase MpaB family protein [Saccharopolyspora gloriosae]